MGKLMEIGAMPRLSDFFVAQAFTPGMKKS
jgi:hypothetical protein